VRRNAVLAILALVKLPKGDLLVPDADEAIERFLAAEQDVSAKRNALVLLTHHAQAGWVAGSRRGGWVGGCSTAIAAAGRLAATPPACF
jgi:hypothetical protein